MVVCGVFPCWGGSDESIVVNGGCCSDLETLRG